MEVCQERNLPISATQIKQQSVFSILNKQHVNVSNNINKGNALGRINGRRENEI